jgi:hypothetical protein
MYIYIAYCLGSFRQAPSALGILQAWHLLAHLTTLYHTAPIYLRLTLYTVFDCFLHLVVLCVDRKKKVTCNV